MSTQQRAPPIPRFGLIRARAVRMPRLGPTEIDRQMGQDRYQMAGAQRAPGRTGRWRATIKSTSRHYIPETTATPRAAGPGPSHGIPALPNGNQRWHSTRWTSRGAPAIRSISSPGLHSAPRAAADCPHGQRNRAQIARAHRKRFWFFATLPLPEIDDVGCRNRYALDIWASGRLPDTNSRGVYLGDPTVRTVFAESPPNSVGCGPPHQSTAAHGARTGRPRPGVQVRDHPSITDLCWPGCAPTSRPAHHRAARRRGAASTGDADRPLALPHCRKVADVPSLREALNSWHIDLAVAPVKTAGRVVSVADPARLHDGSDFHRSRRVRHANNSPSKLETSGQSSTTRCSTRCFRANARPVSHAATP